MALLEAAATTSAFILATRYTRAASRRSVEPIWIRDDLLCQLLAVLLTAGGAFATAFWVQWAGDIAEQGFLLSATGIRNAFIAAAILGLGIAPWARLFGHRPARPSGHLPV